MLVLGGNGVGQVLEGLAHHALNVSIFLPQIACTIGFGGSKPTHACKKTKFELDFGMIDIKLV